MTTGYLIDNLTSIHYMNACKRYSIPEDLPKLFYLLSIAADSSCLPIRLAILGLIHNYNLHMEGSDRNAQQRAFYTRSDCYWWPLFLFLLDVAALNAYILYTLDDSIFAKLS